MHEGRGATSANILQCLYERSSFLSVSSQPCSLIPPHEVLTLASDQVAFHRTVPVPRPFIGAEGEAEAGCAVADLEQAVRTEEGFSFTSTQVIDCLQVVVHCSVAQLLPPLQSPPPQEDNSCHQNQHQDSQNAGYSEGGGGGLSGLTQSRLKTGLQSELTAWTHKTLGALAYRPGEVGETSTTILAWTRTARI